MKTASSIGLFPPLSAEFVVAKRSPWSWIPVFGAAAVLLCVVVVYWQLTEEQRELGNETDQLAQKLEEKSKLLTTKPVDPKADAERKHRQVVSDALSYPWSEVFAPIEQAATVDGVALLTMTHDQTSGLTQLGIEALDVPTALRYVAKLNEESGDSSFWTLTQYQLQQRAIPLTIKAQIRSGRINLLAPIRVVSSKSISNAEVLPDP